MGGRFRQNHRLTDGNGARRESIGRPEFGETITLMKFSLVVFSSGTHVFWGLVSNQTSLYRHSSLSDVLRDWTIEKYGLLKGEANIGGKATFVRNKKLRVSR